MSPSLVSLWSPFPNDCGQHTTKTWEAGTIMRWLPWSLIANDWEAPNILLLWRQLFPNGWSLQIKK